MVQLQSLTKAFGDRILLDNVTWQIGDRDRVGLCGPNGAGKTTLLKMLAGLDEPDAGVVQRPNNTTLGYLPQDGLTHRGRTIVDEAMQALRPLLDMKAEMHALEEKLADAAVPEAEHEDILHRYSDLQDRFRMADGYQMDLKVGNVLNGLGFESSQFQDMAEHLSGGWQMRLALAKLLLQAPDLLLLDEPTNHLDLDARNWLEDYLVGYPRAVIVVSHDRYFLDAVVTRIADLSLRTITDYHCNYSKYLVERDARLERLREAKRRQDEEIERVQAFIDRFRYQATKAAQVQSRIKMLEKVERIEVPPERRRIHFQFPAAAKSGRVVLELKQARKAYGDKVVLKSVDLHIERGDRIALVGHNGAGKSTLMRLLSGAEAPDSGERVEGHQVVMQYFAQDEATRLDPALTVYETLAAGSPNTMIPAIRNILGGFLFSGDDIYKKAAVLSGGERTRLAVARMLLRPSNTLLLDEPTNHLDIDSKEVLLDALVDYGGTLIFVSHDRYFVDRLATKVIDVGNGQALLYPGDYEAFLWRQKQAALAASGAPAPAPTPAAAPATRPAPAKPAPGPGLPSKPAAPAPARDYAAKKRDDAEQRKRDKARKALQDRIADLETRIAEAERGIKELEARLADPAFYGQPDAAKPVIDEHQSLMWKVGELLSQWEMLTGELEQNRT
ncbi:MAG: ABC-F family ATP-binding cassette domain-containing protein [Acidobacteria bacterium]|nr:ABC-F family ATP-binding cassette domain-containing protein [Acidobacteriota bacterium]